jgi:hypothetical protein
MKRRGLPCESPSGHGSAARAIIERGGKRLTRGRGHQANSLCAHGRREPRTDARARNRQAVPVRDSATERTHEHADAIPCAAPHGLQAARSTRAEAELACRDRFAQHHAFPRCAGARDRTAPPARRFDRPSRRPLRTPARTIDRRAVATEASSNVHNVDYSAPLGSIPI